MSLGNPYPGGTTFNVLAQAIYNWILGNLPLSMGGKPQRYELTVTGGIVYNLPAIPDPNSFQLFWNGVLQSSSDYSLNGSVLTTTGFTASATAPADKLIAIF